MGNSRWDCSGAFRVNTSSVMPALAWLSRAALGRCALITANHSDAQTFNSKVLIAQIHLDHIEVRVFRPQLHLSPISRALEAFHCHLIADARYHNLSVTHLLGAVNGQQVAVQYACVFHAHAIDPGQVVGAWIKKTVRQAAVILHVLLSEDWTARSHPTNQGDSLLRIGQAYTPGSTRNDFNGTFARQGLDMLLR